jgi:PRTRC genetic system protein C
MAIETTELQRVFRYNSVELPDPGGTADEVRELYSATYPEIVNAAIEGPEEKDGKLVYTFRRAVGTKGALEQDAVFQDWHLEAHRRGWAVPLNDALPKESWLSYWLAMDEYERKIAAGDRDPGRPVVPHRTGGAR